MTKNKKTSDRKKPERGGEALIPTSFGNTPCPALKRAVTPPVPLDTSISQPLPHPNNLPPLKNEGGPGSTNKAVCTQPAPRDSETPSPDSFSSEGPVSFCTCDELIAYDSAGSFIGPDSDPLEYFWRCPLHQKDKKKEHYEWDTLSEIMWHRRLLLPAGAKLLKILIEASNKRNPYIPLLEAIDKEIAKTEEDIKWTQLAKEKGKEWHREDQESRASKGISIPYPNWLRKYDSVTVMQLQDKRNKLSQQKLDLQMSVTNFRFEDNYDYNTGGTKCQK